MNCRLHTNYEVGARVIFQGTVRTVSGESEREH
jgi:molybdopterin synthase catalytic subunit